MMDEFNELEIAIFKWFQENYANHQLSTQLQAAKLKHREWTGVGFFIDLDIPKDLQPINIGDFKKHWPIHGPTLRSADIEYDGGSILWGEAGYIISLEMYAFGDFFKEHVREFSLLP
ncbi:MAG: hypothetical protein QM730_00820 [Anaerolineales bacterium]